MTPRGLLAILLATTACAAAPAASGYTEELRVWRAQQQTELLADDGWLTVAGLFWLAEGDNRFGSAAGNEIVFPAAAPARAGVLALHGGRVTLTVEPGVAVTQAGAAVTTLELQPGQVLALGRWRFFLIERGGRIGLRLRDLESPRRQAYPGRSWFAVDARYRITARFEPATAARTIAVPNVLGQVLDMPSPGRAVFALDGHEIALDAVVEGPDAQELFFIFRDLTTGKETYPAGRFLYSELPHEGRVVLDFNRAVSPPCAFTDFGTCPLPPLQNRLQVRIPAGETYRGHP